MEPKERIEEFILALDAEIKTLKSGKAGNIIKVLDGRYQREAAGFHIYKFKLENPLVIMDDVPGDFILKSQKYNCQIVSSHGTTIYIGIEEFFGQIIYEARIETNLWFLLEMLKRKYEEKLKTSTKEFLFSENLFNAISSDYNNNSPKFYPNPKKLPNPSQINAIFSSFRKSLSIIWGPPGTGKTTTIAYIAQALLNDNKRILLVSHANTAVDGALEDIAEQMIDTSFYSDGKLIRLGIHKKESLNEFPLVLLDNIEENLGKSLVEEREHIRMKLSKLQEFVMQFKNFNQKIELRERIDGEIKAIEKTIHYLRNGKNENELSIENHKNLLTKKKIDLSKAENTGKIKRMILGLNPEIIQKSIDQIILNLDSENRKLPAIIKKLSQGNDSLGKKKKELKDIKTEITLFLHENNTTLDDLHDRETKCSKEIEGLEYRLSEINKALEEIRSKILSEARLIATTLTKTFSSREFPELQFDAIIIDESSMAPMPYIYWAANKVKSASIIVGDFLQIPPISVSKNNYANKWLKCNIYDHWGINIESVNTFGDIVLLNEQFRMHPQISQISNELFYRRKLINGPSVDKNTHIDSISQGEHLTIIDTSDKNPWCSQISFGGRFNIYNGLVTAKTAKLIYEENHNLTIGILSPYKAQVRLINKILADWNINDEFEIATTHSFQGGENDVILIDCVEGPGAKKWSMLNHADDAIKLLNVAFTRAKNKIYLIVHRNYIESYFPPTSAFLKIMEFFDDSGITIDSNQIISDDEFYAAVDDFIEESNEQDQHAIENSTSFTEQSFWPAFISDLRTCSKNLIIVSPFTSMNRLGKLLQYFTQLRAKGVEISVLMRPPDNQGGALTEHAVRALETLRDWGIKVIQRKHIHQKIAIIDETISWEGSLNILSHNNTIEHMRRIQGEKTAKELIKDMDLDSEDAVNNLLDDLCPICFAKGINSPMVFKKSRYGKFKGCSSFPKCKYIEKNKR